MIDRISSGVGEMQPAPEPELDRVKETVLAGLTDSYEAWRQMDPSDALKEAGTNQFKEHLVEADRVSERAMIESVRETEVPTQWISEEHGRLEFGYDSASGGKAEITAIADGIDGSSNAVSDWENGNYGGIITEALGDDPKYEDCLAAGIVMFTTGKMVYFTKGGNAIERDLQDGTEREIQARQTAELTSDDVIFAEIGRVPEDNPLHDYFELTTAFGEKLVSAGFNPRRTGSTAGNIVDIATGNAAVDLAATRKGNLELMAEYAIVRGAGGVMYALEQNEGSEWVTIDLDVKKFLTYGQDEHIPVLAAANAEIAQQVVNILNTGSEN